MAAPNGGGGGQQAVFAQPEGAGLQVAQIIAALTVRQRQIAAGVVFKVDKAGFAVVAGDDVAAESLAEILIALMDGGDGVQSALPAGNRIGGNFDGVENIGVAQMAEHQRVGVAGE